MIKIIFNDEKSCPKLHILRLAYMYCLNFCFLCFKEVTAVHIQCWRTPSWLQLIGRQCVPRLLSEASVSVMTMSMTVSCSMCTSFPYEDISRDLFGSGGNTKQKQKAKYVLCIGMKRKRSGSLPSMGNNKAQTIEKFISPILSKANFCFNLLYFQLKKV